LTLFGMSPDPWVGLAFLVIAGPDIGNMRGGHGADATSGAAALVSGGLLCLGAVAVVGATEADPPREGKRLAGQRPSAFQLTNFRSVKRPTTKRRNGMTGTSSRAPGHPSREVTGGEPPMAPDQADLAELHTVPPVHHAVLATEALPPNDLHSGADQSDPQVRPSPGAASATGSPSGTPTRSPTSAFAKQCRSLSRLEPHAV
jgi:hypothetical protein